jgi:hypothetical protein
MPTRQPGGLGVLRGVIHGFSEEARTRGFASPALAGFAFIDQIAINAGPGESRQFGEVLKTGVGLTGICENVCFGVDALDNATGSTLRSQ